MLGNERQIQKVREESYLCLIAEHYYAMYIGLVMPENNI